MIKQFEKKISSPPQVLLSDCYIRSPCKDSQRYKYSISKQLPKKTQFNVVLQENCEDSSYSCESTCEQNKISKRACDPDLNDKSSELLQKLEQVKNRKKQTSDKKKIMLDKTNRSLHNKDGERQREYSESNNEQNESALCNVTPHSSSCQDLQEKKKKRL